MFSKKQKELRRKGIGASEVGAIANLNPYKTPLDIYMDKTGEGGPDVDTPDTQRGRFLEPAIRDWYAYQTQRKVVKCTTLSHGDYPFIYATPDGIVMDGPDQDIAASVLEIKAPRITSASEWLHAEHRLPDRYYAQVQMQMEVFDVSTADVAVLMGDELKILTVEYNPEISSLLLQIAEKFWNEHVEKRNPPPPTTTQSWKDYLRLKFPSNDEDIVPTDGMTEELVNRYRLAKEEKVKAAEREEMLKNKIKETIGCHAGLSGNWGTIYYKRNKDVDTVDWKAVAKEACIPKKLIAKHTKKKPGPRVFRAYMKEEPRHV